MKLSPFGLGSVWLKLEELLKLPRAVNRHHVIASKYQSVEDVTKNYISQKPLCALPLAVAQVTADAPSCDNISTDETKTN